jgi:competence protein ComEC
MLPHSKLFYAIIFFLAGVLFGSMAVAYARPIFFALLVSGIIAVGCSVLGKRWFALCAIFFFMGAGYLIARDRAFTATPIPYGEVRALEAAVREVRYGNSLQVMDIELLAPGNAVVRVTTTRYPERMYGDVVTITGSIRELPDHAASFYKKEGVAGLMSYPDMELVGSEGMSIRALLQHVERYIGSVFARTLEPRHAAFLSGLLLGDTAQFSEELEEELRRTGTSHLVALSGYNVTIIASGVIALFGMWFGRRVTFIMSVVAIILFAIMTGADATVVRAGIMAGVVLLAKESAWPYSVRNAMAFAALLMVFVNPFVLAWDVGFQLSFVALLGIVYVKPALETIFKSTRKPGVLSWRGNAYTTAAAQIAVLPILAGTFNLISSLSLLTNVLILFAIPATMFLGFLGIMASLVSIQLARMVGWVIFPLIAYELGVIAFFADISIPIRVVGAAWWGVAYYASLAVLIGYARKREAHTAYAV